MKTIKTASQTARLTQKNIRFNGNSDVFNKYSYFQLVNAYKPIFVSKVMNVDEIKSEIANNGPQLKSIAKNFGIQKNIDYVTVLVKLNEKYNFGYYPSQVKNDIDIQKKIEKRLRKTGYIMHFYEDGTHISDYIRMTKFEHELRNVLLKYTLIIEEKVKNVFCSYLNDIEAKSTFLLDASNYNVVLKGRSAIKSMTMSASSIVEGRNLAMRRKINQDVLPPYWMSIHSFMMNGVIQTIDNLSSEHRDEIIINILFALTSKEKADYLVSTNPEKLDKRKLLKDANRFFNVLQDVGYFRNSLAHNSPIFYYNINDHSLFDYPNVCYDAPFLTKVGDEKENSVSYKKRKQSSALIIIRNLESIFDTSFKTNNKVSDLDLSYMIFAIYNMIRSTDSNTLMKQEILDVYRKYNIVGIDQRDDIISFKREDLEKMLSQTENVLSDLDNIDLEAIIDNARNNKKIVRTLQNTKNQLRHNTKEISRIVKNGKQTILRTNSPEYKEFPKKDRYFDLTGVDLYFLKNL